MTSDVAVFTYGSSSRSARNRCSMRRSNQGIATPLTATSKPATQYRSERWP